MELRYCPTKKFYLAILLIITLQITSVLSKNMNDIPYQINEDNRISMNDRKLQTSTPHHFKIKFQLFKFDTQQQIFLPAKDQQFPKIRNILQIGAQQMFNILQVTNILLPQQTIIKSSVCSGVNVPNQYKTVGFDPSKYDSVIFVGLLNDIYSGMTTYSYPMVVKNWPIYGYLRMNVAFMDLGDQKANTNIITRALLNIYGWSPYYFFNFGFQNVNPFFKTYGGTQKYTTTQMLAVKQYYGQDRLMITTPKIKKFISQYFGCTKQQVGAFIDNEPVSLDIFSDYGFATVMDRDIYGSILMGMPPTNPGIIPTTINQFFLTKLDLTLLADTGFYFNVNINLGKDLDLNKLGGCSKAYDQKDTASKISQPPSKPISIPYCKKTAIANGATQCSQCQDGYYLNINYQCQQCSNLLPNCQNCSVNTKALYCTACKPSFTLLPDYTCGGCSSLIPYCQSCQTNNSNCKQCSLGFFLASDGKSCTTCSKIIPYCSKCVTNGGATTCQQCSDSYMNNKISCVTCQQQIPYCLHCSQTSSSIVCSACDLQNGYFPSADSTQCAYCSSVINGCQTCSVTGSGTTICQLCNVGYLYENSKSCKPCSFYLPNCLQCYQPNDGPLECDLCDVKAGYFQTKTSKCNLCSTIINNCGTCIDNYGTTQCSQCSSGYYLSGDKTKCLSCSTIIPNCATCGRVGLVIQCSNCNQGFTKQSNKCL